MIELFPGRVVCALVPRPPAADFGLDFGASQVPVARAERTTLQRTTGQLSIRILVPDGLVLVGENNALAGLDQRLAEPRDDAPS